MALARRKLWDQSRRIYTEEKAKVVSTVWGTELIHSLAALAILHEDDMKKILQIVFNLKTIF